MTKQCELTGVKISLGNNVSHAHNKTRRRYLPNIHKMTLYSETLGSVRLELTVSTLSTIEHNGGLDNYLLNVAPRKLTAEAKKLRNRIKKAQTKKAA